ncbi:hypothetical protein AB0M22_05770 [Nocardia sp. NPDC051756]|uniref:GAP1-N2 domain-containing protein n=1 Tax=Nocardia sp. NPDC051756 TaxID=3154751 RepID=UPI0034378EEF
MAFSSLLYTECRADHSVHGREGMQFQAESPDSTPEMEQAVLAHLLYRPSPKLMAASTPVDAHPLSFTYNRVRGRYYIAVGRYAGRDSRGREGNQLTHCLVTDDPDDIRPSRPAQLFRSDAWRARPAESLRLDTVAAPLHVAEDYQPAALHAMACAQPDIEEFLPKLLTAFEEAAGAQRKKIVVSATDVHQAIRWIALGSLFLDIGAVLDLSFRVFTETPLADDISIAVFHPELTRAAPAIEQLPPALNGVDLASFRTSGITPSETAVTYSRWFLEYDAFDSLEAIELGRRWQPHLSSPDTATTLAGIVCLELPIGAAADASIIAEALASIAEHEPDDMEEYGSALAETVLTIRPAASDDPGALHRAVTVLRRRRQHDAAEALTLAMLEGARLYPDTYGVRWAESIAKTEAGDAVRARWMSAEAQQRAMQLLLETLDSARDLSLASLFTIIPTLGLGVRWTAVCGPGERLVHYWASYPDAISDSGRTAFYAEIESLLWQELESRIRAQDGALHSAMMSGRWDWLRSHADRYGSSSSVVTAALAAAAVASAPYARRGAVLAEYLHNATAPEWTLFFTAARPADPALLGVWISADPAALRDPAFAGLVESAIDDELSRDTVVLLEHIRLFQNLPPALADIAGEYVRAQQVLAALYQQRFELPSPAIGSLETVDRRFRDYFRHTIADHLMQQDDLAGVSRYLTATRSHNLRVEFYRSVIAHLQRDLRGFAPRLLYLYGSSDVLAWMQNEVLRAFADWIRNGNNKKRAIEAADVLDRRSRPLWGQLVEEMSETEPGPTRQSRKILSIRKFRKDKH